MRRVGLEPTSPKAMDFESIVFASFTTAASAHCKADLRGFTCRVLTHSRLQTSASVRILPAQEAVRRRPLALRIGQSIG